MLRKLHWSTSYKCLCWCRWW